LVQIQIVAKISHLASCQVLGKHHLEITITYKLGEQLVSATYKMDLEVKEAVWSKTISGLIGPTGSLPIHPVGMDVNASVRHHGKSTRWPAKSFFDVSPDGTDLVSLVPQVPVGRSLWY
jgi:hypothetical protein